MYEDKPHKSFQPTETQQKLIGKALEMHNHAQKHGSPAPERLVKKWSSEIGINEISLPK